VPLAVIELMRAADYARREMVAALQPHGITLQQTNVLIILRDAGGAGVPTLEVARRLVEQTPGITRLVNALVTKKYVRRARSRDDARQQLCYLTDKGGRLLDRLLPDLDASCARIMQPLSTADLGTMSTLAMKISRRDGVAPGAIAS
jgi:DNA-binding MarR family transcriptional regulator